MSMSDQMENNDNSFPSAISSGRLSHAYIASGDTAGVLAMAAVCTGAGNKPCMTCAHCKKAAKGVHQDIIVVDRPDKKREILVDQIRELKKEVIAVPGEAPMKAYIVNDADTMNTAAQNAFLKMLEEPPPHVVFILNTDAPSALLPTVRSRCIEIKGGATNNIADADDVEMVNSFFDAVEQGNEQIVRFMFRLEKLEKSEFGTFLSSSIQQTALRLRKTVSGNDSVLDAHDFGRIEQVLVKAGELHELNVNIGHITGLMCSLIKVR